MSNIQKQFDEIATSVTYDERVSVIQDVIDILISNKGKQFLRELALLVNKYKVEYEQKQIFRVYKD